MFRFLMAIFLVLSIIPIIWAGPVYAEQVGAIEDNKASWYAVIQTGNKGKRLYVKGDILSSSGNPAQYLRILDIKKDALILEDIVSKNGIVVKPGENIPAIGAGMIFEKTVESEVVEYNYNKPVKKFTRNQIEDFTIKSLGKRKVVLEKDYDSAPQVKQLSSREKDIFNSPRDKASNKKIVITELFDKIESKKIGDDLWSVDRASVEPAMRNAGAAIISAIKRVEPRYRLGEGPSLRFNTDMGTAVVNKEGFLVQNIAVAKLTERFGIKQGDVIKSINGYPVNSLLGIYRAYENIASDKGVKLLSIDVARSGNTKTLVYKIK